LRRPYDEQQEWFDSMDAELAGLHHLKCFTIIDKAKAAGQQIVPMTWAFKKKRIPDGTFYKKKS
jgi:hypothetical protein